MAPTIDSGAPARAAPAAPGSVRAAAPVAEASRIRTIDVLRGVALLGILLMNIPFFALPEYSTEAFNTNPHTVSYWLLAVTAVVFEGKMRALFGMLFGAGVLLFIRDKGASGRSVHALFYRRVLWLVVFGLIHAHLFLWVGDILYVYGVCGMIVYLFRKVRPRYLVLAVPLVGLLDFGAATVFYRQQRDARLAYVATVAARDRGEPLDDAQRRALATWRELETSFIPNRDVVANDTRLIKSGYAGSARVWRPLAWKLETVLLPFDLADSVALMLLGMALLQLGFFSGKWSRRSYRRVMLVGYGVGLPLALFAHLYALRTTPTLEVSLRTMEAVPVPWVRLIYPFQRMLLVMAHASALILAYQAGVAAWLMRRLAAVGQMALTNYLGHTLICTLLFFGYGLNLYAELQFWQLYLVVAAIWTLQLAVSPWWLARFRFGPFEWLWRALTYGARPTLRRAAAHS